MTDPGGTFGEDAHHDGANPPAGSETPQQQAGDTLWNPPAQSQAADYPSTVYPPPTVTPGYPPDLPVDYPEPMAPTQPEYRQPPGYDGPPYPPPQLGTPAVDQGPPWHSGNYTGAYPRDDYPPDYLESYGATQPGMNVMAIASLISSFTGLVCCIGSIVAIVLGAVALDQIKRTRQEGYGLAIASIVIGIATLLVSLIVAIFALHSH
ncbi:DUF4190 domain-containing protein [Mycobacterium uberis]|uniref:DUF4190 domain-containing protein n=1 Tax=Mycobacterium uberis TaxID=2162698 RepID=A0A3E1HKJ3_9MYCO|nr:DUF4190 domain-containing protein [Mycobacterium uberis]RFD26785.1 DUF4190 domain-containing protein [Mycobacterium uberis]